MTARRHTPTSPPDGSPAPAFGGPTIPHDSSRSPAAGPLRLGGGLILLDQQRLDIYRVLADMLELGHGPIDAIEMAVDAWKDSPGMDIHGAELTLRGLKRLREAIPETKTNAQHPDALPRLDSLTTIHNPHEALMARVASRLAADGDLLGAAQALRFAATALETARRRAAGRGEHAGHHA